MVEPSRINKPTHRTDKSEPSPFYVITMLVIPEPTLSLYPEMSVGSPLPALIPYPGLMAINIFILLVDHFIVPSPRDTNKQDIVPDLKELGIPWEKCKQIIIK